MQDETIYGIEAHSRAKHAILREYLKGWAPIVARRFGRLFYVDAFAGAGVHTNAPGSPIVAIETLADAIRGINVSGEVVFIERDPARRQNLATVLQDQSERFAALSSKLQIDPPLAGECADVVPGLIDARLKRLSKVGPALFFLDQFGYSNVPMSLLARIFQHDNCETLSYLSWNLLNAYLSDVPKHPTITRAFGGDEWKEALNHRGHRRQQIFRDAYVAAIRARAGARFVYAFSMQDDTERVLYWLFFASNSRDGLKVMKRAMWQVDNTGRFQFSDKENADGSTTLFPYTPAMLARDLHATFVGRTINRDQLELFILESTPEYRSQEAISLLNMEGKVRRRRSADGESLFEFIRPPMVPHVQGKLF